MIPATPSLEVSVSLTGSKAGEQPSPISIRVLGPKDFSVTGSSASFSGLPAGTYVVEASAEGTKPASELINLSPDADGHLLSLGLYLEPEPLGYFAGVWDTTWGEMRLTQSGTSVSGTYEYANGKIRGKVEGRVLKGTWAQDEGTAA